VQAQADIKSDASCAVSHVAYGPGNCTWCGLQPEAQHWVAVLLPQKTSAWPLTDTFEYTADA